MDGYQPVLFEILGKMRLRPSAPAVAILACEEILFF
jgi:hypothetical protein